MNNTLYKGRVTIPTDANFVEGTKKFIDLWGADAVRDCDGTELPVDAGKLTKKVYKTYFISRGDNDFAYSHDEYLTNIALISERYIAYDNELKIDLLKGYFNDQIRPNNKDGFKYWQVYDRTTNEIVKNWDYKDNIVTIKNAKKMHEYTVNFFGYSLWNSTQIYNYTCNNWTITKDRDYDLIYPEVLEHVLNNLDKWLNNNSQVNVLRFTTFLYHFFLVYKTGTENKIFDWYNYAMTASPKMFELFEQEYGYKITLEDIVTNGTYSNQFEIPSKAYLDYMDLVQRVVVNRVRKISDKVHSYNKDVMMFWGDNWIGAEPYSKYFSLMNIDAVVGSVSSGVTVRMVSDIPNLKYKEIRLMPYFFPDTLNNDEDSTKALMYNWVSERRAIMRNPVDRIGFGGYLKLADKLPIFCKKVALVCNEFRKIYYNVKNQEPYNVAKIAIMSYWGKEKTWMTNEFSQSAACPLNAGYMGFLECLSGMPVDVAFISFNDAISRGLKDYDVVINMGNCGTSFSGDRCWKDPKLIEVVRDYVANGGGFIGVGEPTAYPEGNKVFQLADVLGVDEEQDKTIMYLRYNNKTHKDHFILEDIKNEIDYAGGPDYIYAKDSAIVLDFRENRFGNSNVKMAVNEYLNGRSFYVAGLNFNTENTRLLLRAILWCSKKENILKKAFSSNINIECHYYKKTGKYALVNNVDSVEITDFYDIKGNKKEYMLSPQEIIWIN